MNKILFQFKRIFLITIVILVTFSSIYPAFARTQAEIQADIDKLNTDISNIKAQQSVVKSTLSSIQTEKDNANDDLVYINSQIRYLESQLDQLILKVSETETQIKLTEFQIEEKNRKISELEVSISSLEKELKLRMKDIFKLNMSNAKKNLETTLIATSATNIQSEFQKSIKENQESVLANLNDQRMQIKKEKENIELKKTELDTAKNDLEEQKVEVSNARISLDRQKSIKEETIAALNAQANKTQQSSAELSAQLNSLKSKLNTYQTELFQSVNAINTGNYVKKGDVIGYVGDTGWSTGAHLHFFVSKNGGNTTDPCQYLPSNYVSSPNIGVCGGNGQLGGPLANPSYTQDFNNNHDAIDLTEYYGAPIHAAHDGYVKRGKEQCYPWFPICKDGGANYVIICESQDCRTGFKTGYWHLK